MEHFIPAILSTQQITQTTHTELYHINQKSSLWHHHQDLFIYAEIKEIIDSPLGLNLYKGVLLLHNYKTCV